MEKKQKCNFRRETLYATNEKDKFYSSGPEIRYSYYIKWRYSIVCFHFIVHQCARENKNLVWKWSTKIYLNEIQTHDNDKYPKPHLYYYFAWILVFHFVSIWLLSILQTDVGSVNDIASQYLFVRKQNVWTMKCKGLEIAYFSASLSELVSKRNEYLIIHRINYYAKIKTIRVHLFTFKFIGTHVNRLKGFRLFSNEKDFE